MFDFTSDNITSELEKLHELRGADFVQQLKNITQMGVFQQVKGDSNIFSAIDESSSDYNNLLNVAKKAVEYGYTVYLLPNPNNIRTADFIFERKGVYKLFDLKTISGKASVGNRLLESIGQTNRVLLNIVTDVNPMKLARCIKTYFEHNSDAIEVLIFKGRKSISVMKTDTLHQYFWSCGQKVG